MVSEIYAEAIPVSDLLATKQDIARLEARLTRLEVAVFGGGAMGLALLIKLAFFS
jgi:threonine dehydrogenase-like Zn-dependent dehydrogenase